jgi:hypothetical protein
MSQPHGLDKETADEFRRRAGEGTLLITMPEKMREQLAGMRDEEIATFVLLVRMGPEKVDQLLAALKLFGSVSTVSKFVKWAIIVFLGFFVAAGAIGKSLHEYWTYFFPGKGG